MCKQSLEEALKDWLCNNCFAAIKNTDNSIGFVHHKV